MAAPEEAEPWYITPNQIVAYNMAYFRKAAGLKQDELGERLAGWTQTVWSKAGVSAAERAWDGKRLRQFDADLVFGLSVVLGVPMAAFYLPPDADRLREEYRLRAPHESSNPGTDVPRSLGEYTEHVFPDPAQPAEPIGPAMTAFRERMAAMMTEYRGAPFSPTADDFVAEGQLKKQIIRLKAHQGALQEIARDVERTMEVLEARMREPRDAQDSGQP